MGVLPASMVEWHFLYILFPSWGSVLVMREGYFCIAIMHTLTEHPDTLRLLILVLELLYSLMNVTAYGNCDKASLVRRVYLPHRASTSSILCKTAPHHSFSPLQNAIEMAVVDKTKYK